MKIYDLLNEIMGEIDDSRKSLFGNKKYWKRSGTRFRRKSYMRRKY